MKFDITVVKMIMMMLVMKFDITVVKLLQSPAPPMAKDTSG